MRFFEVGEEIVHVGDGETTACEVGALSCVDDDKREAEAEGKRGMFVRFRARVHPERVSAGACRMYRRGRD